MISAVMMRKILVERGKALRSIGFEREGILKSSRMVFKKMFLVRALPNLHEEAEYYFK